MASGDTVATIKDVAALAEVSFTTVSHVLNGTRPVSRPLRDRVHAAVAELNFVPSGAARSLKTSRSITIGVLIPNNSNPFFAEVVRGIEDACFDEGYATILCNTDDRPDKQAAYARLLSEKRVDGIVGIHSGADNGLAELLRGTGIPLVMLDPPPGETSMDSVSVDHEGGAFQAVNHLLLLGHKHIACITGPGHMVPAQLRLAGYQRALLAAGITPDATWVREADYTSGGGHAATLALLARQPRPTALFASNDLMALGSIGAASSLGLSVPRDLSVIGFDDIALAPFFSPPLSTVAQPKHESGRLAAQLLLNRISTGRRVHREKRLVPVLCVRQSTAALV